jgi:Mn-dependent DtxR family transcriptional regulator
MKKRTTTILIKEIMEILKEEKELSIRQISLKLKSEWSTTNNALEDMKMLNLVRENKNRKHPKSPRLFLLAGK